MIATTLEDRKRTEPYIGYCPIIEWPYVVETWQEHPYIGLVVVSVCPYCSEECGDITYHAQPALEARS
jgi:hypothetical protein